MAQRTDSFDIGRLGLSPGEGRPLETVVAIDPLKYGGEDYAPESSRAPVTLDVSRTMAGYALRLRYRVRLLGPCMRCLEDSRRELSVDATEIDQPGEGDELSSPYVDGDELDLHAWSRDALALALPAQILCADDCRGLCAVCGENLNEAGADHHHDPSPDPRWSKLSELRFE